MGLKSAWVHGLDRIALNEQEKSVIDYVLVNEGLYNHIDHMEIEEEKTFCPFRTTKLKNGVKTT